MGRFPVYVVLAAVTLFAARLWKGYLTASFGGVVTGTTANLLFSFAGLLAAFATLGAGVLALSLLGTVLWWCMPVVRWAHRVLDRRDDRRVIERTIWGSIDAKQPGSVPASGAAPRPGPPRSKPDPRRGHDAPQGPESLAAAAVAHGADPVG